MDDDISSSLRRMSTRTRKVAPKMAAALASGDNRSQAILAHLEALENDNAGTEMMQIDDEVSLDDDDQDSLSRVFLTCIFQKRQSKNKKGRIRQAKVIENAKKAPTTLLEHLHEENLEALPPPLPSYFRAAVGLSSSASHHHFCNVCGFTKCGMRFCSIWCQIIHNDTCCLKFVA